MQSEIRNFPKISRQKLNAIAIWGTMDTLGGNPGFTVYYGDEGPFGFTTFSSK